jgi:hypothetical protein
VTLPSPTAEGTLTEQSRDRRGAVLKGDEAAFRQSPSQHCAGQRHTSATTRRLPGWLRSHPGSRAAVMHREPLTPARIPGLPGGAAGRQRIERSFASEVVWSLQEQEYRRLLAERGVVLPPSP